MEKNTKKKKLKNDDFEKRCHEKPTLGREMAMNKKCHETADMEETCEEREKREREREIEGASNMALIRDVMRQLTASNRIMRHMTSIRFVMREPTFKFKNGLAGRICRHLFFLDHCCCVTS